jgi:hypothetical protein
LVLAGLLFLGPRVFKLVVLIKEAFLLSFATSSCESAYPKTGGDYCAVEPVQHPGSRADADPGR